MIKYLKFLLTPHLIKENIQYITASIDNSFYKEIKDQKNIYIFGACDYCNLGDYAITIAQEKIIKDVYKNYNVHRIFIKDSITKLKTIIRANNPDDIFTIIGGEYGRFIL